MMKRYKTGAVLLALALLFGCKTDEKEMEYRTEYVNQAMLAAHLFNQGTYWVYENQDNELDSVIVLGTTHDMTTIPCLHGCPGGVTSRYEFYQMNLLDVTNNQQSNYYFLSDHIKLNGGGDYSELGQPIFLFNKTVENEFNGATVVEKMDSMTVLGTTYQNVTKVKITAREQYQQEFALDTYLYFAEHFGMIRKESMDTLNGTEIWNLKRSRIVP